MTSDRPPSGGLCAGAARHAQRGFTIVELVVVMLVLAVVTAIGMSRFADREPFAAQGLADQIVSGLRLAQATATARRDTVHVVLAADPPSMSVCLDAACTQPLRTPGGDLQWLAETQGLRLSASAAFSFDAAGVPSPASAVTLQVQTSDGAFATPTITMEPVSGHVH